MGLWTDFATRFYSIRQERQQTQVRHKLKMQLA